MSRHFVQRVEGVHALDPGIVSFDCDVLLTEINLLSSAEILKDIGFNRRKSLSVSIVEFTFG